MADCANTVRSRVRSSIDDKLRPCFVYDRGVLYCLSDDHADMKVGIAVKDRSEITEKVAIDTARNEMTTLKRRLFVFIGLITMLVFILKLNLSKKSRLNSFSTTDRVDVILLAYARGGSTYVGHILGNNSETLYFYEPLNLIAEHHGYFTKELSCKFNTPDCVNIESKTKKLIIPTIDAMFNCQGVILKHPLPRPDKKQLSDRIWKITSQSYKATAMRQKLCTLYSYRVAKILRISAEYLEELLVSNSKLKIIYLYRDPRGIINSRIHAKSERKEWKTEFNSTEEVSKGLCQKMEIDAKEVSNLQNIFPSRVFSTSYEDIAQYPEENMRKMFNFLDIPIKESYVESVKNLGNQKKDVDMVWNTPLRSNGSARTVQWKRELSSRDIKIINSNCRNVYKIFRSLFNKDYN